MCTAERESNNVSQVVPLFFVGMLVGTLCLTCICVGWMLHENRDRRDPANRWQGRYVADDPPELYDQDDD